MASWSEVKRASRFNDDGTLRTPTQRRLAEVSTYDKQTGQPKQSPLLDALKKVWPFPREGA